MAADIETRARAESDPESSRYWEMELDSAKEAEKEYRENAATLIKLYQGKGKGAFNIFWSNIETLKPVIYSQKPQPDVRQRKEIKDPLGRDVAIVLERVTRYTCDNKADYDFDEEVESIRDEMLITGRGVPRVNYKPYLVETENGSELADQNIWLSSVNYDDFLVSPAKKWRQVRWVAYRHTPTRDECVTMFPEHGQLIPLGYSTLAEKYRDAKGVSEDVYKRAIVWEIWDKQKRQRVWIAEGYKFILKREEDPYRLEGFFPMPKALYAFTIPGTLVPQAEYEIYKKQVAILNNATVSINELTRELKVKGLYAAVITEVEKLATASNGELIPINNLGGTVSVKDAVAWWPIDVIANALVQLYQTRDQAIQTIYQITGISDIIRGATNSQETATAQQIKGNFAQLRLLPRQQPMQRMLRDVFRLKAELIAEHFTPELLQQISGVQVTPQMMQVLRDDKLRSMTVDIETDSTVKADENADREARTEFLGALSGMLKELIPMAQTGVVPLELAKALISFGVRGFKIGRELEDALDALGEQPPAPPKPDPEAAKMQAEMQMRQAELQMKQQEGQANFVLKEKELAANMQLKQAELEHSLQLEAMKASRQAELEKYKADLQADTAMQTSQLNAKTSLKTARIKGKAQPDLFDNEGDDDLITEDETKQPTTGDLINAILEGNRQLADGLREGMQAQTETLVAVLNRPKTVVRDSAGRVAGVQ